MVACATKGDDVSCPVNDPSSSLLFDVFGSETDASSASATGASTASQETRTSTDQTTDGPSPSKSSALDNARRLFNNVALQSGPRREPSSASRPQPTRRNESSTGDNRQSGSTVNLPDDLRRWPPTERYAVATLERRGMTRTDAVAAVRRGETT